MRITRLYGQHKRASPARPKEVTLLVGGHPLGRGTFLNTRAGDVWACGRCARVAGADSGVVLSRVGVGWAAVVGAVLASSFAAQATVGKRDPMSPRLRPVAADVRRAHALLLSRADLPPGFHSFNTGASPSNNTGPCGAIASPNLSALTETAEVYGAGLANTDSGANYLPSAYVFVSAAEAARAQALYSAPAAVKCSIAIAKTRLKGIPAKITGQSAFYIARKLGSVAVRARQAILNVKVGRLTLRIEASLIFFRRGRALAEVWTSSPWTAATRRTWQDVLSAVVRRLQRSGF